MYIEVLFLGTCSQSQPISGYMDVKLSDTKASLVRIAFDDHECAAFQQLAVKAFDRAAKGMAKEIIKESPRLLEIPVADEDIPF